MKTACHCSHSSQRNEVGKLFLEIIFFGNFCDKKLLFEVLDNAKIPLQFFPVTFGRYASDFLQCVIYCNEDAS